MKLLKKLNINFKVCFSNNRKIILRKIMNKIKHNQQKQNIREIKILKFQTKT